jgi:large subunit ribosomal protein L24
MENSNQKQTKFHVRSGDTVKVIAGNSKGKSGVITKVLTDKSRVIIEGVNMIKKHVKPTAQEPQGQILETEGTIHISNVMLIDPATGQPTRTGRKANDKGKLQRFSKKTGKLI